ncbi:MAG: VOC family protein [Defluviicoccus sp.]|nr:VOC family protein [Defluviicoccus sp.]
MPQIRHLAIVSLNPEKLAKFYEEVFEMELLNSGNGAYYLTDGHITLALLPNKAEGKPSGLNHFGFQIEDADEIARRLDEHGMARPAERPADRPYAETRATDPDGNNYDLSVHGYQKSETKFDRLAKEGALEKEPA